MTTTSAKAPLCGKRILVCGKGGSGKSTLVTFMARALQEKAYEVLVLDGDASNPEGLVRLMFGYGVEKEPRPLIDFFGGVDVVTCPVDDPSPLTRLGDSKPVPQNRINVASEIRPEFYLRKDGVTLIQVGKIDAYGQGCDGPLEKVVRDFMVEGNAVHLIDIKAGVEHFGRKVPEHIDIIVGVVDCTRESISIARQIDQFCIDIGIEHLWLVLNKVPSAEVEASLRKQLGRLEERVIGVIHDDRTLMEMALSDNALSDCKALMEVICIVDLMEEEVVRSAVPSTLKTRGQVSPAPK